MTNIDVKEEALGDELLRRGWKQGTLFNAPSIYFTYHDLSQLNTEGIISEKWGRRGWDGQSGEGKGWFLPARCEEGKSKWCEDRVAKMS